MKHQIINTVKHPTQTPLRKKLDKLLKQYIDQFCEKHELQLEFAVADDFMGVIAISDYFFSINDIIYDIDNNLPEELIFKWYDDTLNEKTHYNLHHYYKMDDLKKRILSEKKTKLI